MSNAVYEAAEAARRYFTDASVDRILARCETGQYTWNEALDDFLGGISLKERILYPTQIAYDGRGRRYRLTYDSNGDLEMCTPDA
jgi:hypothetical protein